jgi:LuxR family transcriptional activator of conjugal transfer of Ti plasmids
MALHPGMFELNKLFDQLVERISLVQDEASANEILADFATKAGFKAYAYLVRRTTIKTVVTNLAVEWVQIYRKRAYHRIDPVLFKIRERPAGFSWSYGAYQRSKRTRQFVMEAAKYDIRSGISVPINIGFGHYAVLTLISDKPDPDLSKRFDPVSAAAAVGQVHSRLDGLNKPIPVDAITLKQSELRCLRWSAEGKSMRAIAILEDLSYATICFHLRNAKQSLGVTSLSQATAVATSLHLI